MSNIILGVIIFAATLAIAVAAVRLWIEGRRLMSAIMAGVGWVLGLPGRIVTRIVLTRRAAALHKEVLRRAKAEADAAESRARDADVKSLFEHTRRERDGR